MYITTGQSDILMYIFKVLGRKKPIDIEVIYKTKTKRPLDHKYFQHFAEYCAETDLIKLRTPTATVVEGVLFVDTVQI